MRSMDFGSGEGAVLLDSAITRSLVLVETEAPGLNRFLGEPPMLEEGLDLVWPTCAADELALPSSPLVSPED